MFQLLTKILKPKPKLIPEETITYNEDLYNKLSELATYSNLNALFFSSTNKLYIINTYTNSFDDLLYNFFNTNLSRTLLASNIHSYFSNSKTDLQQQLTRLLTSLSTTKLSTYIEHDLYELFHTFEYLKSLEN